MRRLLPGLCFALEQQAGHSSLHPAVLVPAGMAADECPHRRVIPQSVENPLFLVGKC